MLCSKGIEIAKLSILSISFAQNASIVAIVIGILMIFFGAFGAHGGRKKNNCNLCWYSIGVLIGALIFIVMGVFIAIVKGTYVKDLDSADVCTNTSNEKTKWVAELD